MIRPALWQAASVPGTLWQASKRSWAWVEGAVRWLSDPGVLCLWTSLWLLETLRESPAAQLSTREWISPLVSQLIIYFQSCHLIIYFHSSQGDPCKTQVGGCHSSADVSYAENKLLNSPGMPLLKVFAQSVPSPHNALPPGRCPGAFPLTSFMFLMECHLIIREVLPLCPQFYPLPIALSFLK